jgi:hypothetical protein
MIACAVLGVLVAAVAPQAAKVNTKTDQDKQFDFKSVRTWGWDVEEAGDVKMARAAGDDPAPIKKRYGPTIVDAITSELSQRGLTAAASSATPDLRFHYYLLVTVGFDTQTMGQFLPAMPEWGLPPFVPQTTSFNIIQQGSLVLDGVSPAAGRVVWRGIAQTEIDTERTPEQRDKRLREVIHDLVRRFPKK